MGLFHLLRVVTICVSWLLAAGWLWHGLLSLKNLPTLPNLLSAKYAPVKAVRGEAVPVKALTDKPDPALTVIVPARNEARAIAATLQSLLATEGLAIQIIAVNDRSHDATGEIMDKIASDYSDSSLVQTPLLRVIHLEALPEGWMGKTHAMALAAQMAAAPLLLFTDADVVYRPDCLARAVRFLESERADHLVLVPTLILRTVGERMMIAFLQVVSVWKLRPWRVADPRARHDFVGVGAFNLVRRECYDKIGGFESLRMEVLEDVRLGYKVKRAGYAQRIATGRDLIRIRWADGAFGVVENLTKNAFSVFRFRLILLLAACTGVALQAVLPFAGLFQPWPVRSASLVSLLMIALLYRYSGRHTGSGIIYAATFPAAALLLVYAFLRSMVLTLVHGGVSWRGTFYSLRELRKHCGPLW